MGGMQGFGLGEPDTATALHARGVLANEFDARACQRRDQFRQGIDVAPNNTAAGFHAPDSRHGQAAQLGKVPLIYSEQGSSSPKLVRCYHV
jgi:hypothetical protein